MRIPSRKKRTYDNRLREERAHETRERILRAVSDELVENGKDFSTESIARRAGVSVPSIYRHFENRDVLYLAFRRWWEQRSREDTVSDPRTLEELVDVRPAFDYLERNADLVIAAMQLRATSFPRDPQTGEVLRMHADLLEPLLEGMDEDEAHAVCALFRLLGSSLVWRELTRSLGVAPERAGDVVTRARRALVGELRRAQARRER